MKSGLGDRNNLIHTFPPVRVRDSVSMKSGLGDRNNRQIEKYLPLTCIGLNEVRSWRPEQWLASEGGPDKGLYQGLRALRPTDPCNTTLLSCHGVKHLVKPLRALPRGCDTTTGLAAAHATTGPSSGTLRGTPSITVLAGGVGRPESSSVCMRRGLLRLGADASHGGGAVLRTAPKGSRRCINRCRRFPRGWHRIGQKVVTPSRFMKAPWPVSLFQQVSPFSSEAHT